MFLVSMAIIEETLPICDPTWENRAYVHIKFDCFVGIWNSIPLYLDIVCQWNFCTYYSTSLEM